ncbi:MAG TPA: TonB family protein [Gemmatimonadaceae bacterium]|nr:TonB family protein [Gemmatimonadaceae bacterium]
MHFARFANGRPLVQVSLLCASALVYPSLTSAQNPAAVSGVVTDESQTPVFGATVEITGSKLRARTNERGEFRIHGVAPGSVEIQFRRLGLAPVSRTMLIAANEQPAPLHIALPALAIAVKPVIVQASRVEYTGRLAGYYERLYRRSSGHFIGREEIDRNANRNLSQLIATTPGINALRLRQGGAVRMRGRSCRPLVWLDGTPLPAGEVDLDAFPVNTLHGIELYVGATSAPIAYTAARGQSNCGTILLWSRGKDTEPGAGARRRNVDLEELAAASVIYTADQVDTEAELIERPLQVRYPPALFAAGTSGTVMAEFIVEADGTILPESFEIFSSSHPLFGEAAMQALSNARYTPAVKKGVAVRQFVQQPFSFSRGGVRTSANVQD